MEHVVFYPSADGSPAFRRVGSLDEAVNFVEHIRNAEGVTDFSVHALTAVPLSFRAYYHVEMPGTEPQADPAPAAVAEPVEAAPVDAAPVDAAPVEAAPVEAAPVEAAPAPVATSPFATPTPVEPFVPEPAAPLEAVPAAEAAPVAPAAETAPVDPSVEEVVPIPSGRRSMGFFARS